MAPARVTLKERAALEALSQVLSDWGDLTYDNVIDSLKAAADGKELHEDIIIWQAYESEPYEDVAAKIEEEFDGFYTLFKDIYMHKYPMNGR